MAVAEYHEGEDFSAWLLSELTRAYLAARKGKRSTTDEQVFETYCIENLIILRDQILARRYEPSRGIAFVTRKPVIREIFAAPFTDRVVHHLLYNIVYDWWDRRFIYDSYSCRVGKGTSFGIERTYQHMRQVSGNYSHESYVIKLDIQGYFMSLPRRKLFEKVMWGLERQFPEKGKVYDLARFLWHQIIFDDPVKGVTRKGCARDWRDLPRSKSLFCQPPGKGIVIGNLSSQLISNIYLDALDRYVKYTLGYKYYGRYVDDMVFFVRKEDLSKALIDIKRIEMFLYEELELTLHPKKRYVQNINNGVPFLGAIVYPYHVVPGVRTVKNFRETAFDVSYGEKDIRSLISYLGLMKHLDSKKITSRIFEDVGWDFNY